MLQMIRVLRLQRIRRRSKARNTQHDDKKHRRRRGLRDGVPRKRHEPTLDEAEAARVVTLRLLAALRAAVHTAKRYASLHRFDLPNGMGAVLDRPRTFSRRAGSGS